MTVEPDVVQHYEASELLAAIEAALAALGKTTSTVTVDDLGPVDEFHIGGRVATTALCDRLGITSGTEVLDIGCGIGGTARLLASTHRCRVTGVDLVPDFVDVARSLTGWTGLSDLVSFEVASALELPLEDGSFDAATQLHVGMNIEDKGRLFAEMGRVLRPGGKLGVYDVLRTGDRDLRYPVPWASDESTSFVADFDTYEAVLTSAGFEIMEIRDRREFALESFAKTKQRTAEFGGPPPLGLHVIIGSATPVKIENMIAAVSDGKVSPVEIICQAP